MNVEADGKMYRLIGQEQGECLIKSGCTVLLWYKNGTRRFRKLGLNQWGLPLLHPTKVHVVELPKRYAALVAKEKRLPSSVERAFARGTMAFAVEVE
jgi:hypothetical protein